MPWRIHGTDTRGRTLLDAEDIALALAHGRDLPTPVLRFPMKSFGRSDFGALYRNLN